VTARTWTKIIPVLSDPASAATAGIDKPTSTRNRPVIQSTARSSCASGVCERCAITHPSAKAGSSTSRWMGNDSQISVTPAA